MEECRRIEQRKADEVRRLELARKEEELLAEPGLLVLWALKIISLALSILAQNVLGI